MPAAEYERFSDAAHQAVVEAERAARRAGHDVVGVEHLLAALLACDEEVRDRMLVAGLHAESLGKRLAEWGGGRDAPVAHAVFSPALRRAVHLAGRMATQERSTTVQGRHLLHAVIEVEDEYLLRVLLSLGIDPADVARRTSSRPRRIEGPGMSGHGDSDGDRGADGTGDDAPRRRGLLASLTRRR